MRISIRRCLSMLRNTSDGNELAMSATNAYQREHSVGSWYTESAGYELPVLDAVACCSDACNLTTNSDDRISS